MSKKIFVLFYTACLFFTVKSMGQESIVPADLQLIKGYDHDLVMLTDSMYSAPIPDTRTEYCEQFVKMLVKALKVPGSFGYPFPELAKKINIVTPDDHSFRIFNWNVLSSDVTLHYYGAVQMESEMLKLYPLFDKSAELKKQEELAILTNEKWFGCLYYNIKTVEIDDKKYYVLFGLNKSNMISNRKILDPLSFTAAGPVFGAPIFEVPEQGKTNRFVLEYKKEVQASMNWDPEKKMIIFDRLLSTVNDPNRKYTYVPSGQYDALKWKDDEFQFVSDILPAMQLKDGEAPDAKTWGKN